MKKYILLAITLSQSALGMYNHKIEESIFIESMFSKDTLILPLIEKCESPFDKPISIQINENERLESLKDATESNLYPKENLQNYYVEGIITLFHEDYKNCQSFYESIEGKLIDCKIQFVFPKTPAFHRLLTHTTFTHATVTARQDKKELLEELTCFENISYDLFSIRKQFEKIELGSLSTLFIEQIEQSLCKLLQTIYLIKHQYSRENFNENFMATKSIINLYKDDLSDAAPTSIAFEDEGLILLRDNKKCIDKNFICYSNKYTIQCFDNALKLANNLCCNKILAFDSIKSLRGALKYIQLTTIAHFYEHNNSIQKSPINDISGYINKKITCQHKGIKYREHIYNQHNQSISKLKEFTGDGFDYEFSTLFLSHEKIDYSKLSLKRLEILHEILYDTQKHHKHLDADYKQFALNIIKNAFLNKIIHVLEKGIKRPALYLKVLKHKTNFNYETIMNEIMDFLYLEVKL